MKQRRAIIARQSGVCAAPGCKNTHLEVHYVIWYSHGGRTDLDDMTGLCVRCRHLVHRDLLHVTADGRGNFTFSNRHRSLSQSKRPSRSMRGKLIRPFPGAARQHSSTRLDERRVPLRT
ncbi:HNH endonuclease [Aeromicrobium sp.]|uniref:HNH endonuclease n=1 Tax=Aeromicrobium sp. TaxID=1871063 RepID=UPI003D6BAF47